MSEYVIFTENTSDLPDSYIAKHNIKLIPLYYSFTDDTVYGDEIVLDTKEFYDKMRAGDMPKTMASNVDKVTQAMREVLSEGKDILYLAFSSGLSSTYSNAVLAADMVREDFPDRTIIVIDSLSASLGQGLFVDAAVRKQADGLTIQENADWLEAMKLHVCHVFTVDDLEYLKNGGRISKTTAFLGTLINVKPILFVDNEGHLIPRTKVRGRKKALQSLVDRMAETIGTYKNDYVFISHADCIEDAKTLGAMITERFGIKDIMYSGICPTIGSHAGPGTLALFFFGDRRQD